MKTRRPLAVLFSIVVIDLVGFGIVMPVLPYMVGKDFGPSSTGVGVLVASLGGLLARPDPEKAIGLTLGLVFASYACMQFVFAPLWGRLSDRIGRRPVMLMTIAGSSVGLVITGLAPTLGWLFAGRVLGGVFAANVSVASAYITDVTDESERTRWMGLLGASFGVGFTLGPAIGGLLGPYGYHVPLLFAAGMSTVNLVVAIATLSEPERKVMVSEQPVDRGAVLADPLVRRITRANLLFSLAVTQLETVFVLLMAQKFHYDIRHVAYILVGMAVVMGAIQGGGIRSLAARFGERRLLFAGAVLMSAAFVAIPLAPTVAILLLPLAVSAVGRGICQPSMVSLASSFATPSKRGAVLGTFTSRASLARAVGPIPAGFLFAYAFGAPFWLASVLILAMLAFCTSFPARVGGSEPAA